VSVLPAEAANLVAPGGTAQAAIVVGAAEVAPEAGTAATDSMAKTSATPAALDERAILVVEALEALIYNCAISRPT